MFHQKPDVFGMLIIWLAAQLHIGNAASLHAFALFALNPTRLIVVPWQNSIEFFVLCLKGLRHAHRPRDLARTFRGRL